MKIFAGLVLSIICLFFCSCYYGNTKQETLTIATSANMQYAMEALAERFTENTVVKVVADEKDVKSLQPGDKVLLASKAFNPVLYKIT